MLRTRNKRNEQKQLDLCSPPKWGQRHSCLCRRDVQKEALHFVSMQGFEKDFPPIPTKPFRGEENQEKHATRLSAPKVGRRWDSEEAHAAREGADKTPTRNKMEQSGKWKVQTSTGHKVTCCAAFQRGCVFQLLFPAGFSATFGRSA